MVGFAFRNPRPLRPESLKQGRLSLGGEGPG